MNRNHAIAIALMLAGCGASSGTKRPIPVETGEDFAMWTDGGDPNGGTPDPVTPGDDMDCGGMMFGISRVPPNVMLVLDRSGSMSEPIAKNDPSTKWENQKTAIQALVKQFDTQVRFGLDLFPGQAGGLFGSGCDAGPIAVAVGAAHGGQVTMALTKSAPDGNTPTAATLDTVLAKGGLTDMTRENVVVLATDGQPNCNDVDVTGRINRLFNSKPPVRTFVIGVGDGTASNPMLLNEWAVAGHTERMGATKYFQVNSPQDLVNAFNTIVGGVVSCAFQLAQQPPDPAQLYVWMNGKMVVMDAVDGWSFDPKGPSVTLHGVACDQLKGDPNAKVQVVYGCPEAPVM